MLIGHYAPALALQRLRPSIPLWALFVAAQAVDILWGVFILTGLEHVRIVPGFTDSNSLDLYDMPYSHSVVATVVWSAGFALLWRAFRRPAQRRGEALVIGLAVASHFVLDLVVHVPDLPVVGSLGAKWGFGLWRHRELALFLECTIFVLAALVWWQGRENRRARAAIVLGTMTALLVASYYIPEPPTPDTMAVSGLATYAACAFAAWWAMRTPHAASRTEELS
jgi:membrane-bound metal-dependent hydrolase YbcI (DUF457 family)